MVCVVCVWCVCCVCGVCGVCGGLCVCVCVSVWCVCVVWCVYVCSVVGGGVINTYIGRILNGNFEKVMSSFQNLEKTLFIEPNEFITGALHHRIPDKVCYWFPLRRSLSLSLSLSLCVCVCPCVLRVCVYVCVNVCECRCLCVCVCLCVHLDHIVCFMKVCYTVY